MALIFEVWPLSPHPENQKFDDQDRVNIIVSSIENVRDTPFGWREVVTRSGVSFATGLSVEEVTARLRQAQRPN